MKRLEGAKELIDGELDARTLKGNLRDLSRLNFWLGGAGVSYRAIERLNAGPLARITVLDIGTGAADIPVQMYRWASLGKPNLDVTATDVRPEIVEIARQTVGDRGITVKLAPADRIDEPDAAFDVVHSSMLLHHLEPAEAVAVLREMARVAKHVVIVNDLDRHIHWLLAARILTRIATRNAYTRNDAPLSVRRAYRPNELVDLAAQAGLVQLSRDWAWPRYRYAITFRHDPPRRG